MYITEFRLKLYPRDFATVKSFYRDTLLFPILLEWDDGDNNKGVMFNTGVGIIELLDTESHVPVAGCNVSLAVENVQQLWQKFKDVSYIIHPLRDNSWGDSSFAIHDPEGFQITFFTKH